MRLVGLLECIRVMLFENFQFTLEVLELVDGVIAVAAQIRNDKVFNRSN
jgi:hypothetical protein